MVKICLDAGHYAKYNQSPAIKSYWESLRMWELHLLVKKYMEADYECQVITTRADQTKDLALYERGAMSKGCAAFISFHSNAVGSRVDDNIDYPVAYCLTNDTTTNIDEISAELGGVLVDVVAKIMGTKQPGRVAERKASSDKNKDGMLNDNYYGVLNGARQVGTPGIILEHSFHTNTRSTNWLLEDNNLDKLAKAEADAIAEYFGLKAIAPAQSSKMYYVQTGAYSNKENAIARYKAVKKAGFNVCMVKSGGLYKVQVGAYIVKFNAERMLEKVDDAGFEACITTKRGTVVAVEDNTQDSTQEKYTQEQFIRDVQSATGSKVDGVAGDETIGNTITVSIFLNYKHPVVKFIQKYLKTLGYYDGAIDGIFGKKSAKAVENLQKDIGANADGEITRMNKTWRFLLGML